jgi:uncharacterized protein (DUF305 family)
MATTPTPMTSAPSTAAAVSAADARAFDQLYRARKDSAMRRFTPADVDFMQGMIHHHAQALVMSRLAEPNGASAQVKTLAARIINAQSDEIALMQAWLRQRAQPVPELHEMAGTLMVHMPGGHDGHHAHMPGMLSDAQLDALRAARGAEFDRLFLTYMIQHHKGAVTMVEALFRTDGAGQDDQVFKFASDAQVDQSTEIARMELMLAARAPRGTGSKPAP